MRKQNVVLGIVLIALTPLAVYAQNSKVSDSSVIKPCEAVADELKVRRIEVEGLREQIRLFGEQEKRRDEFEKNQADIIEYWKEAATARKDALNIDNRIEGIRLMQLADYKTEVGRLRDELAKMGRSRTRWFLGGLVIGAVVPKIP